MTIKKKKLLLRVNGELGTLEHGGGPLLQRKGLAPSREGDTEAVHPVGIGVGLLREADWTHLKVRSSNN